MLVNHSDINEGDHFHSCVIGAGVAGLTLATALAKTGKKIALLEGGGFEFSEQSQAIYRGTVQGDKYFDLDATRLRFFGGSSNHWGGWCRHLDEIDFESKDQTNSPNWPIEKKDLDPFLDGAHRILETAPIPEDRPLGDSGLKQIYFTFSPPVNLGETYREPVLSNSHVHLVLNANVLGFETNGRGISGVKVADYQGTERFVRADTYVLAAGGIENSRILLWSNAKTNNQVVKNPSALGRYWMEHPHFTLGEAILTDDLALQSRGAPGKRLFFSPTRSTMAADGILNCALKLNIKPYGETKQIIADLLCVAPNLSRALLDLFEKKLVCGSDVQAAWEQAPNFDNRIELSGQLDGLGVPRVALHWKKFPLDLETVRKTALRFGAYLAQSNAGRLRLDPWVLGEKAYPEDDELAGHHHMGGTRMAETPSEGVVDRNCKVFGQENLYVAGSSVFPSSGHANPTMTIVQLALRLAQHLD